MNEIDIDDIEKIEKEKEIQEKARNMMKIPLTLDKTKYVLKLYLSEEKNSIIFKLEQERILTHFYFEKFFLHDFRQRSRIFIIDYSITQILSHVKKLLTKSEIVLEKKDENYMIITIKNEMDKYSFYFEVKKIILAQNQLNPRLVEQMQENKAIVKYLQKQIIKLNKIVQEKNDLINYYNISKTNINKTINEYNININNINNINAINNKKEKEKDEEKNINLNQNKKTEKKEEERPKENKETSSVNNCNNTNNNNKEIEKQNKELEDKRYISNNRKKKNKKKNKKIKLSYGDNQNKNQNNTKPEDNTIFCFENVEIIGNKKIFELLVVFNVIMILIILCLIGSIYSIKSNLDYEKVLEDEFMNKLSYLNVINDYGDDDFNQKKGIGDWDQSDFLFENEQQKMYFKEELISRENNNKIKDIDFILKYKSSIDGKNFATFFNNCKGIEENLLLIRNERAQKFALLSKNIVEVLRGNKKRDFQGIIKNFVMYNFNRHDIFEYNFTRNFEEIYSAFIKTIFGFFTDNGNFEGRLNFIGRIVEIEIYQLKYIK